MSGEMLHSLTKTLGGRNVFDELADQLEAKVIDDPMSFEDLARAVTILVALRIVSLPDDSDQSDEQTAREMAHVENRLATLLKLHYQSLQ